jgi:hypothetical protein
VLRNSALRAFPIVSHNKHYARHRPGSSRNSRLAYLNRTVGTICLLITLVFYGLFSCFPWAYGSVGFGNRFFVSLTPIFILGLASAFAWSVRLWRDARAASFRLIPITLLLVVWNLGLVYQWQTHLMPRYGDVDWQELVYNQFRVVPAQALHDIGERFRPPVKH